MGVWMVFHPDIRFVLARVHTHINLLGFMAMMIYGVGYHILPRFMGKPVYSHRVGNVQVWLANITLIGLTLSWILESVAGGIWHYLAVLSAIGQGVAIFLFIYNLWKSMTAQPTT
jgi:cytochrome c oxidase cbb3-type subunit 1